MPGYLAPTWTSVVLACQDRSSTNSTLRSTELVVQGEIAKIGDSPPAEHPEEFTAIIKADSAKWGEVVQRSGANLIE